jgi:hypothetical protein
MQIEYRCKNQQADNYLQRKSKSSEPLMVYRL